MECKRYVRCLRLTALSLGLAVCTVPVSTQTAADSRGAATQANAPALPVASDRSDDYVVGSEDVLTVTVWNQRDLSGDYIVESDGTFTFPLVGRVKAGGLTLRGVESELKRHLSEGYFRSPQVSVSVQEYQSQRVYLVGEVKQPGTYPLTRSTTLIEVLSRGGATMSTMSGEVVIVRPRTDRKSLGPMLPDQEEAAEVIRVDLRDLESGRLSRTLTLRDGDTILVPQGEKVFVTGEVRNPGAYTVSKGTTVLQLLSLAGGVTDRGAIGRIRTVRDVAGQKKEVKLKVEDAVQPGDTITVPQKFF